MIKHRKTHESIPARVVIVGSSCAGKTTFARHLASLLGSPRIELDALFWGPEWQPKPTGTFRQLTEEAIAAPSWVADGNYSAIRDLLWPRATTIIWLNYGLVTVLWRAVRRTVWRSLTRGELWHGNRESFRRSFLSRDSILLWVITTFHRRRREFATLRASGAYPHLCWVEFRRPAQAAAYLRSVARSC